MRAFIVSLPVWFALVGVAATGGAALLGRADASAVAGVAGQAQLASTLAVTAVLMAWAGDSGQQVAVLSAPSPSLLLWIPVAVAAGWLCLRWELAVARALAALARPGRRLWASVRDGASGPLLSLDLDRARWWVLAVALATAEEILWRGVAVEALVSEGWGELSAVAALAALFGLNHVWFGLRGVVAKAGEGLLWGALALASANVATAVVSHVVFNLRAMRRLARQRRSMAFGGLVAS